MAKTTSNLGLIKPERSDNYSVDVMVENMDIIDSKITALEAGEIETVHGNLHVTPAFVDTGIGSYKITLDSMEEVVTANNPAGTTKTYTTNTITVTDVSIEKRNGLDFDLIPLRLVFSASVVENGSPELKLYVYHNGVEIASHIPSNYATTAKISSKEIYVSKGDTLYAKATCYDKNNARSITLKLTIEIASGNLYFG